jgi:AraC-like DNA-binding protein
VELVDNVSAIQQCLAFLDSLGIKDDMAEAKVLESSLKTSPGRLPISARHIVDLLESASQLTKRADVGVRFAAWLSTQNLGPLAVLGDQCSSFEERFRLMQRFSRLENNAISFGIKAEGDEVSFYCNVHPAIRPHAQQFTEGLIALNVRIARRMLGEMWRPLRVEFTHVAPSSVASQRAYFGCPVYYEADNHAFVLRSADFYRKLPRGNEKLLSFFEQYLIRPTADQRHEFVNEVEAVVALQLTGGNANIGRIASLMAMSPRTLQRRLAAQGTAFSTVLANVRMLVLREYLPQHGIQLARLAHVLGFSEPSAACHFIKARTGLSATLLLSTMTGEPSD